MDSVQGRTIGQATEGLFDGVMRPITRIALHRLYNYVANQPWRREIAKYKVVVIPTVIGVDKQGKLEFVGLPQTVPAQTDLLAFPKLSDAKAGKSRVLPTRQAVVALIKDFQKVEPMVGLGIEVQLLFYARSKKGQYRAIEQRYQLGAKKLGDVSSPLKLLLHTHWDYGWKGSLALHQQAIQRESRGLFDAIGYEFHLHHDLTGGRVKLSQVFDIFAPYMTQSVSWKSMLGKGPNGK